MKRQTQNTTVFPAAEDAGHNMSVKQNYVSGASCVHSQRWPTCLNQMSKYRIVLLLHQL